ncbi:MAG: hypothetical protein ACHQK8_04350 [Bacteroidia bacterium]
MAIDSLVNDEMSKNWDKSDYELWGNSLMSDLSFWIDNAKKYPTIYNISTLGIINMDDHRKYKVTIGITANVDSVNNAIIAIYSIIAVYDRTKNCIRFENITNEIIKDWYSVKIGNVIFYKEKEKQFNRTEADWSNHFSDSMAAFFKLKPIQNIVFFSSKNSYQVYQLKGIDYIGNMFFAGTGGFAIRGGKNSRFDHIIFSGNNMEKYDHEFVHLYTDLLIRDRNSSTAFADEGIATFLGGSDGHSLSYHLTALKDHLHKDSSLTFDKLFSNNAYKIDGNVKSTYSVGGLFAKLIYTKRNVDGLITFLNASQMNLKKVTADLLGVNENELAILFYEELEKY